MSVRYPPPLKPGDLIGVTSPSSGASGPLQARLDVAIQRVRAAGYGVEVGACMDGSGHVSAPADARAQELMRMFLDPAIRAIVPPWGGETAIDLLDILDWDALAAAEPTWLVGFSDMATILTPYTLRTGAASIHGQNLMDTPYRVPEGLLSWLDIVAMGPGATFTQRPPGFHRNGFVDYAEHPQDCEYVLDVPGSWVRLDDLGGDVDVTGRLIGGCIETLANLAGTPYLDTAALRGPAAEGLIGYVEAAQDDAPTICRNLHGMRMAGFLEGMRAVLVGRTYAPSIATLSQHDAIRDALGRLGVPIVADVECGHWAPYLPLVNGALARVEHAGQRCAITQTLA